MKLNNKTALITGGSEGLGFSIAKELLKKNVKVIICGRTLNKLETAKTELNHKNLLIHQCDISDYDSVEKMVNKIGVIDILINNAGVWMEGTLENNSPQEISKTIDINTKGAIFTTRAILPQMLKRDDGYIFNISSTSGLIGKPEHSVYVASKFAVSGFTDSLKIDLKNTNVKVAGFYPGGMHTTLFEKTGNNKDVSKWMDTDKVAEIIVFLLERDNSMILDHVVLNKRV